MDHRTTKQSTFGRLGGAPMIAPAKVIKDTKDGYEREMDIR